MFVLIYLHQTSEVSMLSKETALQLLVIAWTNESSVAWSFYKAGGIINPAFEFALNFWDKMKRVEADPLMFIWLCTVIPFFSSICIFNWIFYYMINLFYSNSCCFIYFHFKIANKYLFLYISCYSSTSDSDLHDDSLISVYFLMLSFFLLILLTIILEHSLSYTLIDSRTLVLLIASFFLISTIIDITFVKLSYK